MIFTDRTITVRKGESRIDEPIVVYRGDYELEVRFTILNSRFKFMSGTNMIESEKASYGQLAILTPYGGNIFSDIVRCNDGSVTFVLTAEMLNQIEEVGLYSFQIRLMDYNKESRVSIPPIEFGIEIREPIASEDHDNSVNNAIVGYSIAKVVDPKEEKVGDTFDGSGNYNKTKWKTGDRISQGKLNKIEDAIDSINRNEIQNTTMLSKRVDNGFNVLDSTKADIYMVENVKSQLDELVINDGTDISEVVQSRVNLYGNIFYNLNNRLNIIEKGLLNKIDKKFIYRWSIGTTNPSDGTTMTNNTRITTDSIYYADSDLLVSMNNYNSYKFGIRQYPDYPDTSNSIDPGWLTEDTIIKKGVYFRINVSKNDGSPHNMKDAMTGELFDAISIVDNKTLEYILTLDMSHINYIAEVSEKILGEYGPLKYKFEYVIAYLSGKGELDETKKYRISSKYKILSEKDTIFSCDIDKYSLWVLIFDSKGNVSNSIELSRTSGLSSTTIPKNTTYMITVGRRAVDTSEIFNSVFNDVFFGFVMRYSSDYTADFDYIRENRDDINYIMNNLSFEKINEKNANIAAHAHRGYSLVYPENTMIAYKEAYRKGFRILETDVKFTSDNIAVLLHDNTINSVARNSDGSKLSETINISDITYDQASNYDFGIYKGKEFAGTSLSTLKELLLFAKKHDCYVQLDGFSFDKIDDIYDMVVEYGMLRNVCWSSFNITDLEYILSKDKKAHVICLSNTVSNEIINMAEKLINEYNNVAIVTNYKNIPSDLSFISYAHYHNLKIGVYSINSEQDVIEFVENGMDIIITDGINVASTLEEL